MLFLGVLLLVLGAACMDAWSMRTASVGDAGGSSLICVVGEFPHTMYYGSMGPSCGGVWAAIR